MQNFRLLKCFITVFASFVAVSALGNTAKITNISTDSKPITIVYKIAHKNSDGNAVFGDPQTIKLTGTTTIPFELEGYDKAGIVAISVDGHIIPSDGNQFDQPRQCALTTDKTHKAGEMNFEVSAKKATCSIRGGVFG